MGEDDIKKNEDEEEVTIEALDCAQSFGRMVLMAPSLQKWLLSERSPADVVAVCKALARTKFFDGDIIGELQSVVKILVCREKLDFNQTNEVICCFRLLNAYDRGVFAAIAKSFKPKIRLIELGIRKTWLEVFQHFEHKGADDFLQMLEVPPLLPNSSTYKKIRCLHEERGNCVLGASCTYSHDSRAPYSLAEGVNEDWWRSKPLVMTQNQKTMGAGVYGINGKEDSRTPPVAPGGWFMTPGMHGTPGNMSVTPGTTAPAVDLTAVMANALAVLQQAAAAEQTGLQQVVV